MSKHILSKSTFMRGCQCTKALYLYKKHPELIPEISEGQQALFDRGTDVGELARQLFPRGTDARPATAYEYAKSVLLTQKLIREGCRIIYEAAFQFDGVVAAIDILVKEGNKWKAYEVKSATEIKPEYILDTSLQYYVITNSGLKLHDISVVHINNKYVRKGELEVQKLFKTVSVKEEVKANQKFVEEKIAELKGVLRQQSVPQITIGPHCSSPHPCDFINHCWKHIPQEHSVFSLSRIGKAAFVLVENEIFHLDDVPDDFRLPPSAKFQLDHYKSGEVLINRKAIKDFLRQLVYPVYFFDFETIMPPVPEFDISRPYQQIPFQYSLHVLKGKAKPAEHFSFLGDGVRDPREALILQMINNLGKTGSVVTYNMKFEKAITECLAGDFLQYSKALESITDRMVDLMKPFQNKSYYHPDFEGSYSIKSVLPAIIPGLSYGSLDIQEGGTASLVYSQLRYHSPEEQLEQRNQLLEYCKMDTLAMVKIVEFLDKI